MHIAIACGKVKSAQTGVTTMFSFAITSQEKENAGLATTARGSTVIEARITSKGLMGPGHGLSIAAKGLLPGTDLDVPTPLRNARGRHQSTKTPWRGIARHWA